MNAFKVSSFDRKVADLPGADGDTDRVEFFAQMVHGNVFPDRDTRLYDESLLDQEVNPPVDEILVELEVRDTVAEISPHAVGRFKERYGVACLVKEVGARQARWPAADDGHCLPGAMLRRRRLHQSERECLFDDRQLVLSYGNCVAADGEHTGGLAQGGADPAGKFREIVCFL